MSILPNDSLKVQTDTCYHLKFDLELPILRNKAVALVGDNGVGKSSLLKWIKTNFLDLSFNFTEQTELSVLSDLTLKDALGLIERRVLLRDKDDRFSFLFDHFKAENFWTKEIALLSGGQKQMSKILLSNFFSADGYFFDEPFQNLDQKNKQVLKEYFDKILKAKKALWIVDHQFDFFPDHQIFSLEKEKGVFKLC